MSRTIKLDKINKIEQDDFMHKRILKEQCMKLFKNVNNIDDFHNISSFLVWEIFNRYYDGYAFFDPPNGIYGSMHVLNSFILYNYGPYNLSINILSFAFQDPVKGSLLLNKLVKESNDREIKIYATFHVSEIDTIELCKSNGFILKDTINDDTFEYTLLEYTPEKKIRNRSDENGAFDDEPFSW